MYTMVRGHVSDMHENIQTDTRARTHTHAQFRDYTCYINSGGVEGVAAVAPNLGKCEAVYLLQVPTPLPCLYVCVCRNMYLNGGGCVSTRGACGRHDRVWRIARRCVAACVSTHICVYG
jgi:hypothetical protein